MRDGEISGCYSAVWEKIGAKNYPTKTGLLGYQDSIFIPQKQSHKNTQNKFQKLFLVLESKTTQKIESGDSTL